MCIRMVAERSVLQRSTEAYVTSNMLTTKKAEGKDNIRRTTGERPESRSQMPNNGNEISEECVSAQSNWEKCNLESGTCSSGAPCGSFPALLWLHSRIRFGPEGALSSEGMKTHIILFCEVQESSKIARRLLFEEFFCDLYLSVGDMLAHVVVEVLDLVELDRAHRAHVGGPFLAARFCSHSHSTCHAHSRTTDSAPGPTSSNRHGQSHHARPRLRHRHGNRDGGGASGTGSACHPSHSSHPGDSRDPSNPSDPSSSAVQGHVALQQGLVGELLLADVALVGLLAAVQPHVDVERALLGEALVADAALVGADACVRDHVFDKSED